VLEQDDAISFSLSHIVDQPQALRLEGGNADGRFVCRRSRHGDL
jgi:hypothetical protein